MKLAIPVIVILALAAGVWAQGAPDRGGVFDDKAIDQAIEKGKEFLWSKRHPDCTWGPYMSPQKYNDELGLAALAVDALIEGGVDPKEERLAKSLEWMRTKAAAQIKVCEAGGGGKDDGPLTYDFGLLCAAYHAANQATDGKYLKDLEKAAEIVWKYNHNGGMRYEIRKFTGKPPPTSDNSNAFYSLLAVWSAQLDNIEVPKEYWTTAMDYWTGCQCTDGGWNYLLPYPPGCKSYGNMSAAGVASMFVCYDNVFANDVIGSGKPAAKGAETVEVRLQKAFKPIQHGLDWFDKNFVDSLAHNGGGWGPSSYFLYCVGRVGIASGYKYFGTSDWYKMGAKRLIASQGPNGGWGDTVDTALSVLFLARGRNPILFNKLQHGGDWYNRPRDLAMLTRWLSTKAEKPVGWQIINLKVPVSEWHDAPILYISGSKDPKFTDDDIKNLKTFILQGGTIMTVTELGGSGFATAVRSLCAKMFPQYPLGPVPDKHELYTCFDDLHGKPKFNMVSNGVRPLVIHVDMDLSRIWQLQMYLTDKWAFLAGRNVCMYVTDWNSGLRPRGTTLWPEPTGEPTTTDVKIVRLDHSANADPEPMALDRFKLLMSNLCHVKVEVEGPLAVSKLGESAAKVALMSGTKALVLSKDDKAALEKFVAGGGMLIVEAAGGSKEFAQSAQDMIFEMYGADSLNRVSSSSPVYQLKGMEIDKVKYRRRTKTRLGKDPNLRAVMIGDRPGVVFSAEDLTAGLVGYSCYGVDGYDPGDASADPGTAFKIMRNLVLFAARGYASAAASGPASRPPSGS